MDEKGKGLVAFPDRCCQSFPLSALPTPVCFSRLSLSLLRPGQRSVELMLSVTTLLQQTMRRRDLMRVSRGSGAVNSRPRLQCWIVIRAYGDFRDPKNEFDCSHLLYEYLVSRTVCPE